MPGGRGPGGPGHRPPPPGHHRRRPTAPPHGGCLVAAVGIIGTALAAIKLF
ncbi:MAG: hypothetical protein ACI4XF_09295 [Oscillospiraceae bacterium]